MEQVSGMNEQCNVVVVDDDPLLLDMLNEFLSVTYCVHTAMDALQAVDLLTSQHVNLLITDLHLPIMDGVELIEQVRADARFNQVAILILTAYPPLVRRIRAPVQGVLLKPFDLEELAQKAQQSIVSMGQPCA